MIILHWTITYMRREHHNPLPTTPSHLHESEHRVWLTKHLLRDRRLYPRCLDAVPLRVELRQLLVELTPESFACRRHLLPVDVLGVRVENAAAQVHGDAGDSVRVDAHPSEREHADERLDDRLDGAGDARRQRRVVGGAEEDEVVEQASHDDDQKEDTLEDNAVAEE